MSEDTDTPAKKVRGRPRSFDPDRATERALRTFWSRGYQATSMSDLCEAIGIGRASLYGAFGDKDAVFRRALDRYRTDYARPSLAVLDAHAGVREAFRTYFDRLLAFFGDTRLPGGCLVANSATQCHGAPVARDVAACLAETTAAFRRRLQRAQAEGEIPPGVDVAADAEFLSTVMQGMAVMARAGAAPTSLSGTADTALRILGLD